MARAGGVYTVGKYRLQRLGRGWAVVWNDSRGTRRRYRLEPTDEIQARQALDRFARGEDLKKAAGADNIAAIWKAYIDDRRLEAKRSVPIMEYNWKALSPTFGHLSPAMISKKSCMDYAARRRHSGIKDGTILTELRRLRTALTWAVKAGILDRAPSIWLPAEPRSRDRWLTRDEVKALIDGAPAGMPHVKLYIILALASAGRSEAILQLTWDRVDFDAGIIVLDDPTQERTSKGRATVPMNDMARAALAVAKAGALTEHVIEWKQDRVRSIKKGFAAAVKRAGIAHCTPHDIRRTAASWMVMEGVPLHQVAKFLGHGTTRMVEKVYGRFAPDYLRAASQAVNVDLRRAV